MWSKSSPPEAYSVIRYRCVLSSIILVMRAYLVQLDDVRVSDELQDLDLPRDSLDIALIDYLVLLEYLDRNLLLRGQVHCQEDLPEGAFS